MERILELMGEKAKVVGRFDDEDRLSLSIDAQDPGLLIGKQGQTLEALQYLLTKMVAKRARRKVRVFIDIESYRARHQEALTQLAIKSGEKVKKTGKPVTLNPMNPHDRRIIHLALQGDKDIEDHEPGGRAVQKSGGLSHAEKRPPGGQFQLPVTWPEAGDTIAAISTPPGEAGIGIVRLSGPEAEPIARRLFRPRRSRPAWQSHRLYLGHLLDAQGHVLDEVLLTLMRAPHTYTRQDMVEIHCHSGYAILRAILQAVLAQGARLAKPGEFTLRAFLSGRLDLSQAEGVLEVIQARTESALRVAQAHLAGGLGRRLAGVRVALLGVLAQLEAALDFPEEGAELTPAALKEQLADPRKELERLLATYRQGRLLREGVRVVLAGRPNVGKSSLLNRLLNADRAIVTDIPGTTRDVIEETVTLGGLAICLSDTAGLREARDRVEELGVARSREQLAQADLVLYLVDASEPPSPEDTRVIRGAGRPPGYHCRKQDRPAPPA